jgi:cell wall-associated NlpC family hydrolase
MIFIRNVLLLIIIIQFAVLVQLFSIKHWNLEKHFSQLYAHLTLQKSSPHLTKEEENFYNSLKSNAHQQIKTFSKQTLQNHFFTFNQHTLKHYIRKEIELNAKQLLGIRYVWGATGPNKFDCSGFTQKVYRKVGINLPRVSREQAKVGRYIPYEKLKRGDMVFFATNRKDSTRVTHVGIYLKNGKFIHASSGSKKVVITDFEKKHYYKTHFLWGRRIITQKTVNSLIST